MAAAIEAMFHQVYVEPKDRDAFLWWPTGDLNEEPREYCMVKHLFGATLLSLKTVMHSYGGPLVT